MKFADINCKDYTAIRHSLHLAAWIENADFIKWLIDEGQTSMTWAYRMRIRPSTS